MKKLNKSEAGKLGGIATRISAQQKVQSQKYEYYSNPDECGYIEDRDINAALNIDTWGWQEVMRRVKKSGPERAKVLLDVVLDTLSSDGISSTQLKEEAATSLESR